MNNYMNPYPHICCKYRDYGIYPHLVRMYGDVNFAGSLSKIYMNNYLEHHPHIHHKSRDGTPI